MSLRLVRNDITLMATDAIVNTANERVVVGSGCDFAIYNAAGYDELLEYRKSHVGEVREGEAFITPGFNLQAKYIIHAVSPLYVYGDLDEETKLRNCYRNSLRIAKENDIKSISFPLISTGGFGYPREAGLRIALDEINAFLMNSDMDVYLVLFDDKTTNLGIKIYPDLEAYIDANYVEEALKEEDILPASSGMERRVCATRDTLTSMPSIPPMPSISSATTAPSVSAMQSMPPMEDRTAPTSAKKDGTKVKGLASKFIAKTKERSKKPADDYDEIDFSDEDYVEELEKKIKERLSHMTDSFSDYLIYLIQSKGMENVDVYTRAVVDKKVFSKIKNNPDYHPKKITALCLCMGARLNLDESKDLLARAGYALSPCDKTDIIFSYFIENKIYDIFELDIQLEEHGLPCIIE